nr:ion channel [uncultured Tolumonas sp.]
MNELNKIYKQNLFLTLAIFFATIGLPFSKNWAILQPAIFIIYLCCYVFISYLMSSLVKKVLSKESSIQELRFLYLTLIIVCASGYFLFSIIDMKGTMISGLSEIHDITSYKLNSFNGLLSYFNDLVFTFINSIYYSIVVMATIGDSSVTLHNGFPRMLVAFEVAMTISLTVFKISSLYNKESSEDLLKLKNEIIKEINNKPKIIHNDCLWCKIKSKIIR